MPSDNEESDAEGRPLDIIESVTVTLAPIMLPPVIAGADNDIPEDSVPRKNALPLESTLNCLAVIVPLSKLIAIPDVE